MRDVIKERWKFFLKTNSKAECLNAISIMHIFQQLDIEKIEQFELSQTLIKDLVKHHIFKEVVNQEIIYYFEHDFIEKFFSEEYFPLCQYAFKKIVFRHKFHTIGIQKYQMLYMKKLYVQKY